MELRPWIHYHRSGTSRSSTRNIIFVDPGRDCPGILSPSARVSLLSVISVIMPSAELRGGPESEFRHHFLIWQYVTARADVLFAAYREVALNNIQRSGVPIGQSRISPR